MQFKLLSQLYEKLENTSSTLEKSDILGEFFKDKSPEDLEILPNILTGNPFPPWKNLELGIASQLMIEAISKATGASKKEINDLWREKGDLGLTTSYFLEHRRQITLFSKKLALQEVYSLLEKICSLEGKGSQELKINHISELISNSSSKESIYLVRLILGIMRIGVGEGIIRDGLSKAFEIDKNIIEKAFHILNDYGQVARITKEKGEKGLMKVKMKLFFPVKVMLAQKVDNVEEGFEKVANEQGVCAVEFKLDGMRAQIHKKDEKVKIFTRRLEDVTNQFPDAVSIIQGNVDADECIIDAEITAHDPETFQKVPFQELSKRIKRKYEIKEMTAKIPIIVNAFDILFLEGENKIDLSYKERWEKLKKIVRREKNKISLVPHLETSSKEETEKFYKKALKEKQEGLMLKNLESVYNPGSRVGYMVKLKPVMENLDLVIVKAEWGEGKRLQWLSSFELACLDVETNEFKTIGKMATGLTDEQFEEMTKLLKKYILEQDGRKIILKPKIVVEVAYSEIQKSPTYASGFALRFPRLVQVRNDLSAEEIDDLKKIEDLYEGQ